MGVPDPVQLSVGHICIVRGTNLRPVVRAKNLIETYLLPKRCKSLTLLFSDYVRTR